MNRRKVSPLAVKTKSGVTSLLSSVVCILIGLALGYLFLLALNAENAYEKGFIRIIKGGFYLFDNEMMVKSGMHMMPLGQEIVSAAPLIMCGLSVAFAFKTGLFNIGAAGQYTLGALGGLWFAIVLKMPWWVCLLAATACGAIWGAIPGIFKALLNVNEVITCIMFNWVGLYGANTIMYGRGTGAMYDLKHTKTWALSNVNPKALIPSKIFGWDMYQTFKYGSIGIAIFLAIIVAIVMYIILNKTTFGYELKACGHNKFAAKYAGINEKKNIILSMVIAGALAGFGAGLYYLAGAAEWKPQDSSALPAVGFNGISVALLASSNPIGCIFSGLLISHLSIGGNFMEQTLFPSEISDAVSGIIVYLCAFSMLFKSFVGRFVNNATDADRTVDKFQKKTRIISFACLGAAILGLIYAIINFANTVRGFSGYASDMIYGFVILAVFVALYFMLTVVGRKYEASESLGENVKADVNTLPVHKNTGKAKILVNLAAAVLALVGAIKFIANLIRCFSSADVMTDLTAALLGLILIAAAASVYLLTQGYCKIFERIELAQLNEEKKPNAFSKLTGIFAWIALAGAAFGLVYAVINIANLLRGFSGYGTDALYGIYGLYGGLVCFRLLRAISATMEKTAAMEGETCPTCRTSEFLVLILSAAALIYGLVSGIINTANTLNGFQGYESDARCGFLLAAVGLFGALIFGGAALILKSVGGVACKRKEGVE
jgi:simple sugar transport system permease protein